MRIFSCRRAVILVLIRESAEVSGRDIQRQGREGTRRDAYGQSRGRGSLTRKGDLRAARTEDLCARMQPVTTGVLSAADTATAAGRHPSNG
jgi:hypothetical protein